MNDSRDPTHVYLEIMRMRRLFDYDILAAADRVEKDRRAGAQASVSLAPSEWVDVALGLREAPWDGAGSPSRAAQE